MSLVSYYVVTQLFGWFFAYEMDISLDVVIDYKYSHKDKVLLNLSNQYEHINIKRAMVYR